MKIDEVFKMIAELNAIESWQKDQIMNMNAETNVLSSKYKRSKDRAFLLRVKIVAFFENKFFAEVKDAEEDFKKGSSKWDI